MLDTRLTFALRRAGTAFAMVAVTLTTACGDNILDGGGGGGGAGAPEIAISSPDTAVTTAVAIGDPLPVTAHIEDRTGIAEVTFIGIAHRGDPDLGTDEQIVRFTETRIVFERDEDGRLPTDTILTRILQPTGEGSDGNVIVTVTATDSLGNTSSEDFRVQIGGPSIRIEFPEDGTEHGVSDPLPIGIKILDPTGIEFATLEFGGLIDGSIDIAGVPAGDSIMFEYTVPGDQLTTPGTLTISVRAVNELGVETSGSVDVEVTAEPIEDGASPVVTFDVQRPRLGGPDPRVEMLDSIIVVANATDDRGIVEMEVVVEATVADSLDAELRQTRTFSAPIRPATMRAAFPVRDLYEAAQAALSDSVVLPDRVELTVSAIAVDASGNADTAFIRNGGVTRSIFVSTVGGRTISLPLGGVISDAAVDTARARLFLSNFTLSRVDVLELVDSTFSDPILVGAQPWGLFVGGGSDASGLSADTLYVANSGGTNISIVPLDDGDLDESANDRLLTPNATIFQFTREVDETAARRYAGEVFGYSDRPQFIAQATSGALLFSTLPTDAAPDGSIRMARREPTWEAYEVYFLFPGGDPVDESNPEQFVVLNADEVLVESGVGGDVLRVIDHVPGFPDATISVVGDEETVFADARAQGSDVVKCPGSFSANDVGLQDTTFVAASANRAWIAFGEGATSGPGRIIMFNGATTEPLTDGCVAAGQSSEIEIVDLVHNAAERVTGLGLNQNGTLGVARGDFAAYYFGNNLQMHGSYYEDISPGGMGAALHPQLVTAVGGTGPTTLSFIGTAERTIRIVDTFHFAARGEIPIRDRIAGPLRATLPLPGDNAGLSCPGDPRCVVVKLFGVTQSDLEGVTQPDGVVIIDVREADVADVF